MAFPKQLFGVQLLGNTRVDACDIPPQYEGEGVARQTLERRSRGPWVVQGGAAALTQSTRFLGLRWLCGPGRVAAAGASGHGAAVGA